MIVDRAYRIPRVVPPGWVELRHFSAPCDEYPLFDVKVEMEWSSGNCRAVLYSAMGVNRVVPCAHPAKWECLECVEVDAMAKWVKSHVEKAKRVQEVASKIGQAWIEKHPALWEYLTLDTHENGQEREKSMLCIFIDDGFVKVALQDRDEGLTLWMSGNSLPEAVDALEAKLQAGDGEWRPSGSKGKGRSGRGR